MPDRRSPRPRWAWRGWVATEFLEDSRYDLMLDRSGQYAELNALFA